MPAGRDIDFTTLNSANPSQKGKINMQLSEGFLKLKAESFADRRLFLLVWGKAQNVFEG